MKSVGIIGFGRFGKILANILQKGYSISAYDLKETHSTSNVNFCSLDKVLDERVIFIAVPIRNFKALIKDISPKLKNGTTLIDVCSVKSFPVNVMLKYVSKGIGIIATHPMFGPDSFTTNTKLKSRFLTQITQELAFPLESPKKLFLNDENDKLQEIVLYNKSVLWLEIITKRIKPILKRVI